MCRQSGRMDMNMFHALKKKQKPMTTPLEMARMYDEKLNTDEVLFSFFYNRLMGENGYEGAFRYFSCRRYEGTYRG